MIEPRNPFRMLASEHIASDSTFLRLFGPGVLELLSKDEIWDRIQILRSAPGGGKTSLFRILTPQALLTLHDFRSSEEYRELYLRLKGLDVISEAGPTMLGIYLSCARNYAAIEDFAFDRGYKNRLLYSLLNSRIILATLLSALALNRLTYPGDLSKLQIKRPNGLDVPSTIPVPCSGAELYEWASSLERHVCKAIDSFAPIQAETLTGHDTLYCLFLLRPECIFHKGTQVANRTLLMLDDVHKLTSIQRKNLLDVLCDFRLPMGIWLAERLEALTPEELLSSGARTGREYAEPITLEEYWRVKKSHQFEKTVANIADRRARLNPNVQIGSLEGCLQSSLDGHEWNEKYREAFEVISNRIDEETSATKKFDHWKAKMKSLEGTPRERANAIRSLEIMIARETAKAQKRLFDLPISLKVLVAQDNPSINAAAELFIAKEFKVPYYFGFYRLARLASSNIEQFLMMGGELFEEVISAALLKKPLSLSPTRQEQILKKVAERRWNDIRKTVPNGGDVIRFLNSINHLCQIETFRPNAPYAPGVTGIAISMRDREKLIDSNSRKNRPGYDRLARTLSACISNNLLEATLDRKQGKKGSKTWMILYLNRLLCLHLGLSVHYGGWRSRSLNQLCLYVEQGFLPPKSQGSNGG